MINSLQTKISTRMFGSFPVLRCFPHLCRSISLAAGAALLLAGCSKDTAEGPEHAGGGTCAEITVSASLPASSPATLLSRAVVDGSQPLALRFARSDETVAGTYGAYGAEFAGTRAAGPGNMPLSFIPRQFYLLGGLKARITGWYPGGASTAGSGEGFYDAAQGTVSWTIDGSQDIISSSAQEGSSATPMGNLIFKHRLAQIQFWPYAESDEVAAQWGAIERITLLSQPDECTLTLPQDGGSDAVFSAVGKARFTVGNFPSDNLSTTAAFRGDPIMAAPMTDDTALQLLLAMTDGTLWSITVPPRSYPAGSVTAIKLKFTPWEVRVRPMSLSISDWADGGELKNGTYPYVRDGNTIVTADVFGAADPALYPTHDKWTSTPAHSEREWDGNASGLNSYGEKFKVASQCANGKDGSSEKITWYEAAGVTESSYNPDGYSSCAEYSEASDRSDKGTWRLPTVRELKLIYDKRAELTVLNLPPDPIYWATSEYGSSGQSAWFVNFSNGYTDMLTKNSIFRVRCVRDV